MQAANQELQIHDGAHHAQKTTAVADGTADQHDGPRGFAVFHLERLPVIGAAVAGCIIGMLQLALQESVRGNAPGRDALRVRVQQRGIGKFVRGRNEVFQQGAQFRRFNVLAANVAAARHLNGRRKVSQHHP